MIAEEMKRNFYEVFKEQIAALAEMKVDLILIDTMCYLPEAVIAVQAATDATKDIPVICTMAFKTPPASRPDDFRTLTWANGVAEAVDQLAKVGAKRASAPIAAR